MTIVANPFDRPEFNLAELTKSINLLPNNYGRIRQLGVFGPGRGITTRTVIVEMRNNTLTLLPTKPVGADGTKDQNDKRNVRSFVVPHIPHDGEILPDEYQGVRAFGSGTELETLSGIMNTKLQRMKGKHGITLEHLLIGGLKGQVLDSDGSVLFDFYQEFGVAKKIIYFDLDNANSDVHAQCLNVSRHIEDNLLGDISTGTRVPCSEEFFTKFTKHAQVKDAYALWRDGEAKRADMRKGFEFGGLIFEEYRGKATDPATGASRRFIAAGKGHAYPEGTADTFDLVYAPADFAETANTIGLPIYVKQEARKFNRGIDLHSQSNPLPLCYKPGVLVEVDAGPQP